LEEIQREVIETLSAQDRKVTDKEGRYYSLRARSYHTPDHKIDGVVITLIDIDGKKQPNGAKASKSAKQYSTRE
jgi:two-component system CheB/CheR fusion protein